MPVLDSRDRQGNVRFPYNAATLAAFTIFFTAKLVVKLDWFNTLSKLKNQYIRIRSHVIKF